MESPCQLARMEHWCAVQQVPKLDGTFSKRNGLIRANWSQTPGSSDIAGFDCLVSSRRRPTTAEII